MLTVGVHKIDEIPHTSGLLAHPALPTDLPTSSSPLPLQISSAGANTTINTARETAITVTGHPEVQQAMPAAPSGSSPAVKGGQARTVVTTTMTRSQAIYQAWSKQNPLASMISGNDEFFLFMDMRADLQWYSPLLTPAAIDEATRKYNEKLQQLCREKGQPFVRKLPQALINKLTAIEELVKRRLREQRFACAYHIDLQLCCNNAKIGSQQGRGPRPSGVNIVLL